MPARPLCLAIACALALIGCGSQPEPKPTPAAERPTTPNLDRALEIAGAEGRRVMVRFTAAGWCQASAVFEGAVQGSSEWQDLIQGWVVVVVEIPLVGKPVPAETQAMIDRYGLTTLPTLILLDGEGKELRRLEGTKGNLPTDYLAALQAEIDASAGAGR